MKKSLLLGVLAAGLLSLPLYACGGDDSGGDGDGDTATGGTDGSGGRADIPCEAAEAAGGAGGATAVCVNDTDCPHVSDGSMRQTAKDCLVNNCLGADDQAECTAMCLGMKISTTDECNSCYGASAACSAANCLSECISDGDAPGCVKCQMDNGCLESFAACSGLAL